MSDRLRIEGGIYGGDQESSFMNATLQAVGMTHGGSPVLDMSIAVHVDVPQEVAHNEEKLHDYLQRLFRPLLDDNKNVSVEIQTGPYGDGE